MEGYHRSVLLGEVLKYTEDLGNGWFLDCTLGDGGHSLEVLRKGGRIVGLDVDPQALERTRQRFESEGISEEFNLYQNLHLHLLLDPPPTLISTNSGLFNREFLPSMQ